MVKEQLTNAAKIIIRKDGEPAKNREDAKLWAEMHGDIVEWMTEPTKFAARSDCG